MKKGIIIAVVVIAVIIIGVSLWNRHKKKMEETKTGTDTSTVSADTLINTVSAGDDDETATTKPAESTEETIKG